MFERPCLKIFVCTLYMCKSRWMAAFTVNGSSSFYPIQRSSICRGSEFPPILKSSFFGLHDVGKDWEVIWKAVRSGECLKTGIAWVFFISYMNNPAYTKYTYDIYNSYTHILIYCKYILLSLGILHGFPFPHHFYESRCLVTAPDGAWWIQDTFGPLPIPIDSTFANIALACKNFSRDEEINRRFFDPFLAC